MTRNAGMALMSSSAVSSRHSSEKTCRYKLLYPVRPEGRSMDASCRWFPPPDQHDKTTPAEEAMEVVIQALEARLGCQRHAFNLDELWKQTRPEGQPDSLDAATGSVSDIDTASHLPNFSYEKPAEQRISVKYDPANYLARYTPS